MISLGCRLQWIWLASHQDIVYKQSNHISLCLMKANQWHFIFSISKLVSNLIFLRCCIRIGNQPLSAYRDHFVYAPNQWETIVTSSLIGWAHSQNDPYAYNDHVIVIWWLLSVYFLTKTFDMYGAHFTNLFSVIIRIWWTFSFALFQILIQESPWNFAYGMYQNVFAYDCQ